MTKKTVQAFFKGCTLKSKNDLMNNYFAYKDSVDTFYKEVLVELNAGNFKYLNSNSSTTFDIEVCGIKLCIWKSKSKPKEFIIYHSITDGMNGEIPTTNLGNQHPYLGYAIRGANDFYKHLSEKDKYKKDKIKQLEQEIAEIRGDK